MLEIGCVYCAFISRHMGLGPYKCKLPESSQHPPERVNIMMPFYKGKVGLREARQLVKPSM